MELRHLRYFIAVAEEGSLTLAAERRLHTAQPSLSRQIRDLESELGVQLLVRSVQGVKLTAAGVAFLDQARLTLAQADAAAKAARHAALPFRPTLSLGFVVGHEADWLPRATRVLRDELLNTDLRISSGFSTALADDLQRGKLDVAFLRREQTVDLEYRLVEQEPLVAVLPRDHPLAARKFVNPDDLTGETFIGISEIPRVLRGVVNDYLRRCGARIVAHIEIDNFAMAISMITATGGIALLPASINDFLPPSLISRLLWGKPTIDLMIGYHKSNRSPVLKTFLDTIDKLDLGKLVAPGAAVPKTCP